MPPGVAYEQYPNSDSSWWGKVELYQHSLLENETVKTVTDKFKVRKRCHDEVSQHARLSPSLVMIHDTLLFCPQQNSFSKLVTTLDPQMRDYIG